MWGGNENRIGYLNGVLCIALFSLKSELYIHNLYYKKKTTDREMIFDLIYLILIHIFKCILNNIVGLTLNTF